MRLSADPPTAPGSASFADEPKVAAAKPQRGQDRRVDVLDRFVDCLLDTRTHARAQERIAAAGSATDISRRSTDAAVENLCSSLTRNIEICKLHSSARQVFRRLHRS